jgi:hypothetical protein
MGDGLCRHQIFWFKIGPRDEYRFGRMVKTSSSYLWLKTLWFFGTTMRAHCGKSVVRFAGTLQLIAVSGDDLEPMLLEMTQGNGLGGDPLHRCGALLTCA